MSYFGGARRLAPAPSPLVAGLFSPGPWVCFVFVFPFFFLVRGMARFKVELESVGNHVGSRRVSPLSVFTQSHSWCSRKGASSPVGFQSAVSDIFIPILTIIWA